MALLRSAITGWAAGGVHAHAAQAEARTLGERVGLRSVVLVEGVSDRVAVESLAVRIGRELDAEGVCVVPMGGAMSIGRFLELFGAAGLDVQIAGLCDVGEEPYFQRALERAGRGVHLDRQRMQALGFYVCMVDLEDELIRSLGASAVLNVLKAEGDDRTFQTFQRQPAQRARPVEQQLRRFMGTISGRKERYARSLVDALDLARLPDPFELLLARV
ncbi:MAG TPA: ATP-dependent endonuclease [Microbacteriaceae bacterium]|jgi:hypothetical protein|nr:ATP-dependent endonuclease [Microbacteriaceae bacterium]